MVPAVSKELWSKAQVMKDQGWHLLGYKYGDAMVLPSVALIREHMPATTTQVEDQRKFIKTWALEHIALVKNPKSYKKATDGTWSFDVIMDMLFSFWVLAPIPDDHLRKEDLAAAGIYYTCTCPQYSHYHVCKHVLALGLAFGKTTAPLNASNVTVGVRSAPPGVTLAKRTHCMIIDA